MLGLLKRKKNGFLDFSPDGEGSGGLPIASSETLGGVRVGEGLNITNEGILSVDGGGGIDIPTTGETKVAKIGNKTIYACCIVNPTNGYNNNGISGVKNIYHYFGFWTSSAVTNGRPLGKDFDITSMYFVENAGFYIVWSGSSEPHNVVIFYDKEV